MRPAVQYAVMALFSPFVVLGFAFAGARHALEYGATVYSDLIEWLDE